MQRYAVTSCAALILLAGSELAAQGARSGATITGIVRDDATQAALSDVLVRIEDVPSISLTDSLGRFVIRGVPPGPRILLARRVGYSPTRIAITVPVSGTVRQNVILAESALTLEDVTVTADATGRARGELGTATVINREAIENQVTTSLRGVLELVPGVPLSPPGLDGVQQFALRSVPTSFSPSATTGGPSAADIGSFGTLIVLDGVPLSNNANLQSTGPRGELQFLLPTSSGGGIDLRRLPASTIDRVEVIRGVPSARYGDLTNGVIVVDTRAGVVEPTLALQYDARTAQGSFLAGRQFGHGQHTFTLGTDFARTRQAPGLRDDDALRGVLQLAHRGMSGVTPAGSPEPARLVLDGRVDFSMMEEDNPERPEVFPGRASSGSERVLRLSERARLALSDRSLLEVTAAFGMSGQRSNIQSLRIRGALPFTNRLTEGRQVGKFIGGEYLSRLSLDGDPRLIYSRAELETRRSLGGFDHTIRIGGELRREWNGGNGYQFDIEFPPQVSFNGVQGFDRPRAFSELPPLATSALYLDDRLLRVLPGDVPLTLQLGVRLDALHDGSHWFTRARDLSVQPRVNAELGIAPWLRVRAGFGEAAKLPTLASLYPPLQYFDVVNVNWYTNDPAERLAILTTFIRDPTNADLGFSVARKMEAGLELSHQGTKSALGLVVFRDRTRDAVGFASEPAFLLREHFDLVDSTQGTGQPPTIIEPASHADSVPILLDKPSNNLRLLNEGVEITATLPEIPALRTHIEVQGAWIRTRLEKDGLDFGTGFGEFQLDGRIPRSPYWLSPVRTGERSLLTWRVIHHQPALGLVVTATIQNLFNESTENVGGSDSLSFDGYITRGGSLVSVAPEDRTDPQYQDLREPRTGTFFQPVDVPSDWMMSLQVAKSLPAGGRLSFYAFNVLDRQGRITGSGGSRQFPGMRFGAELTIPLGWIFPSWQGER